MLNLLMCLHLSSLLIAALQAKQSPFISKMFMEKSNIQSTAHSTPKQFNFSHILILVFMAVTFRQQNLWIKDCCGPNSVFSSQILKLKANECVSLDFAVIG